MGQRHITDPDEIGGDGQALALAVIDDAGEGFIDILGNERDDAVQIAVFKGHQDHFIGPACATQKFGDVEIGINTFHRGQRLGGGGLCFDVIGDIQIRPAFDDVEIRFAAGGGFLPCHGGFFEPFARAKNTA